MPGILPMKVIKVGTSSQSRIAQACDRCRSKKIRCDGIRPTCTQCSSVGFECRTSDKLSRRAFPRGYTESLEERVRQLETEVRELKDLLDEKDEKIDMLSKMHGNQHRRRSITSDASTPSSAEVNKDSHNSREDTFRVQASPLLLGVENSDSFFMGASSGRSFIETVKRKVQETGKPCSDFNPEAFLHIQGCAPLVPQTAAASSPQVPPRLFSDRCVNVYFQEWAALFPILHKPTFLRIYEEYVADPTKIKSHHKIAQLYLVFSIAGLSSESPDLEQVASCEKQWIKALDAVLMENTMQTLQCLLLALLYCTTRADYKRLQHYKGIAVGLSHRLGLHQSQKRFSFGALTIETRKKVFWTLYTLDCFTSAILGLPKLLKDEDVQAEFPADTDDEYVTEKGFQPTLPGEYTRLSSALALFRATRILASVLERNYPATTSHELSLQQMGQFEGELNEWKDSLPDHLKLNFVQDKPSTGVTGSRSPLLALAYYYIRTLIYRPAVGSTLGVKAAPALLSVSESSKHMIQIMELLEERSMTFSFCLNKCDVLVLCGMTLLYQVVDLKKDSKMLRDNEHMLNSVMKTLERLGAPGCRALKRVSSMFVAMAPSSVAATPSEASTSGRSSSTAPSQHASPLGSYKKKKNTPYPGRRMEAAASESDLLQQQEKLRRMTMPNTALQRPDLYRTSSRHSLETAPQQELMMRPAEHRNSLSRVSPSSHRGTQMPQQRHNLDYLSFSNTPSQTHPSTPAQAYMAPQSLLMAQNAQVGSGNGHVSSKGSGISNTEWEALLGSLDGGMNNVYDAIYGGTSGFINESSISSQTNRSEWSPDSWDLSGFNIGDAGGNPAPANSVLSISDESLSSGEEVGPSELGLSAGSIDYHQGPLLGDGHHAGGEGDFGFDTLEAFAI